MKKCFLTVFLFIALTAWGQTTTSPPVYDDEDRPIDLAIEKPKAKKVTQPSTPAPQTAPQPTEAATTETPTPATPPASTPATVQPSTPPEPTPVQPPPAPTPTLTPSSAPVTETKPVPATPIPPPVSVAPVVPSGGGLPADGGPQKDAGSDLSTALPVTYSKYEENSLSSEDMADIYQFYARGGEGIGVILIPTHPSTQLAVQLLGEAGELLSQTQAPQPGAPISFQTSPIDKNKIIYIQIKDINLAGGTPTPEIRKYSLELKPIIAFTQPTPPPTPLATPTPTAPPPAEELQPAPPEAPTKKEAPPPAKVAKGFGWLTYGLIGISVLVVLLVVLLVLRKRRTKNVEQ